MTEKSKNKIRFTVGKRYRKESPSTKRLVDLLGLVCAVLERGVQTPEYDRENSADQ